uniref:Protein kinase domain-containing protein n=1 Tax=Leersia perrieri TaxID=77586 RepID=A0A0D9X3Z3_9ORYZ
MAGFSLNNLILFFFISVVFYLPPSPATALSFEFPNFSQVDQDHIKFEGNASFGAGYIDITSNNRAGNYQSMGRVSYNLPMQLWNATTGEVASFTTGFNFGINTSDINNKGDGMAFFLVSYPSRLPDKTADGGTLGLTSKSYDNISPGDNRFVAVEFDTFVNRAFDPNDTYDHIGIDVNSIRSVKTESLPSFSLMGNMTAVVDYNSSLSVMSVELSIGDSMYNLSYKVDLKGNLPEKVAVGFSAATGASVELHQLYSWYFNSSFEEKKPIQLVASPPPPRQQPSLITSNGSGIATVPPPSLKLKTSGSRRVGVIAGTATGASLFVVILFAVVAVLMRRRHQRKKRTEAKEVENGGWDGGDDDDDGEPIVEIEMGTGPRRFPYDELVNATKSFAEEEKLGQGGFGAVYRGYLREQGLAVAIKRFAKDSSKQGMKEYKSEIKVISRLRHRNLVQLIGWCHGRDELLLVYELVPNRSLDIHLHGNGIFLTWLMRIKIVIGLGSALLYLHEEWDQCVVHRDIKPSNVMLDESFNAKLGDFGLARLIDHTIGMQTMTAVSGTPGYVDPECVITGSASAESDIYSFGIVLVLEVACGRRPLSILDSQKNGVFRLVEWAWDLYGQGAIVSAADERLNGDYDVAKMERVIAVGLWCAHPDPSARPSIKVAMAMLQSNGQLPVLPAKMPVPTYLSPAASVEGPMKSSAGLSSSSATQSSSTEIGYATHTSSFSDTSTSAGSKDSSSLLKHQY